MVFFTRNQLKGPGATFKYELVVGRKLKCGPCVNSLAAGAKHGGPDREVPGTEGGAAPCSDACGTALRIPAAEHGPIWQKHAALWQTWPGSRAAQPLLGDSVTESEIILKEAYDSRRSAQQGGGMEPGSCGDASRPGRPDSSLTHAESDAARRRIKALGTLMMLEPPDFASSEQSGSEPPPPRDHSATRADSELRTLGSRHRWGESRSQDRSH